MKSEDYILNESQEINMGEQATNWVQKVYWAFPAFRHRNYRLYFVGQLISLIGTWLQTVAQGWLVLQLTHSAFWVGTITAISTLPALIFSLLGGVIIDRFPTRNVLLFTQVASFVLATTMGLLTIFNIINLWSLTFIALLIGVVNAVDMPGRQAFAVEMVGKEDLHSAIAMNSGIFNSARVIGPALAGILIATIGVGGAFIVNGFSFLAVIVALWMMRINSAVHEVHANPLKAIKDGLQYAFAHKLIRLLLLYAAIVSIFGWSYTTLLPVIAEQVFYQDAAGLSTLYVWAGFGALLGTLLISSIAKRFNPLTFIFMGSLIFCFGVIAFSFITDFRWAMPFMFLSGLGLIMQFATMNTTIQKSVEDSLRGRVMSLYTLMFLGLSPIGSFEIGIVAQYFGSMFAIRIGAVVVLVFSLYIYFYSKQFDSLK